VIGNGYIRQPDPLCYAGPLAEARDIQLRWLASVFELRFCATRQKAQSCKQSKDTLQHAAHNRTILSHE
jgi:hypothetical protein